MRRPAFWMETLFTVVRRPAFWMETLFTVLHNSVLVVVGGAIVSDVAEGSHPLVIALAAVGVIVIVATLAAFRDTYRDDYR